MEVTVLTQESTIMDPTRIIGSSAVIDLPK